MKLFASAYGRALFPGRFGPRGGAITDGSAAGGDQPMELAPGGLEIDMSAGIYRVVCALEELLGGLRQLRAEWRARPVRRSGSTPVGCG